MTPFISWLGLVCLLATPPTSPACDPLWLPITRDPGLAFFVAVVEARDDSTFVAHIQARSPASPPIPPGPVFLVPWAYGPDCRPLPWQHLQPWKPAPKAAVYTGYLRPKTSWRAGHPTVDLHMAVLQPLWQLDDPRWPAPGSAGQLLTPAEFLTLLAELPTAHDLERTPGTVRDRLAHWAEAQPDLARREPAKTMLANVRRAAEARLAAPH
jgi:hypothetical protein